MNAPRLRLSTLLGALLAASLIPALAQSGVVGPSAVGFYNLTLVPGRPSCITDALYFGGDPDHGPHNRLVNVVPKGPDGLELIKRVADGSWQTNRFAGGVWEDPEMTLSPGEAAVAVSPQPTTLTFVGTLLQGAIRTYIPAGRSLAGSAIPQSGRLFTELGLPLIEGLAVSRLGTDGEWSLLGRITRGQWTGAGAEPSFQVGEGFQLESPSAFVWERKFLLSESADTITFASEPEGQTLAVGDPLVLSAVVNSPIGIRYQWQRNGVDLPAATNATYRVDQVTAADAGDYWITAWDSGRLQHSALARVTVGSPSPALLVELRRLPEAGRLEISLTGRTGERVSVQRSPDLVHWQDVPAAVPVPATFTVTNEPAGGSVFFRARSL